MKRATEPGISRRHGWYSQDDGAGHLAPEKIAWVELRGPMDCSVFTQEMWQRLLNRLGPDPLNGDGPEKAVHVSHPTPWAAESKGRNG